jgi:hypothetical protein
MRLLEDSTTELLRALRELRTWSRCILIVLGRCFDDAI